MCILKAAVIRSLRPGHNYVVSNFELDATFNESWIDFILSLKNKPTKCNFPRKKCHFVVSYNYSPHFFDILDDTKQFISAKYSMNSFPMLAPSSIYCLFVLLKHLYLFTNVFDEWPSLLLIIVDVFLLVFEFFNQTLRVSTVHIFCIKTLCSLSHSSRFDQSLISLIMFYSNGYFVEWIVLTVVQGLLLFWICASFC